MTESVHHRGDRIVLRYERELSHPIDVVWRAITDPGSICASAHAACPDARAD
jgi:hypothetical protein